MSGPVDIGAQYLHYQVESHLAHREYQKSDRGRDRSSPTSGARSFKSFEVSGSRGSTIVVNARGLSSTARISPKPLSGSVPTSVEGLSLSKANRSYQLARGMHAHAVYGQANGTTQADLLRGNQSQLSSANAVRSVHPSFERVYVYVNPRTGVVRLRDYAGRLSKRIIQILKGWAKIFRRNGRVES